ncbi:MAG: hypothetical protein ACOCUH_00535 [Bacteriovoracia bacterium]
MNCKNVYVIIYLMVGVFLAKNTFCSDEVSFAEVLNLEVNETDYLCIEGNGNCPDSEEELYVLREEEQVNNVNCSEDLHSVKPYIDPSFLELAKKLGITDQVRKKASLLKQCMDMEDEKSLALAENLQEKAPVDECAKEGLTKEKCFRKFLEEQLRRHYFKNLRNRINNLLISDIQVGASSICADLMKQKFKESTNCSGDPSIFGLQSFDDLFMPVNELDSKSDNMCLSYKDFYKLAGKPEFFADSWMKFVDDVTEDNFDLITDSNSFHDWIKDTLPKSLADKDLSPHQRRLLLMMGDMPYLNLMFSEDFAKSENSTTMLSSLASASAVQVFKKSAQERLEIEKDLYEYYENMQKYMQQKIKAECEDVGLQAKALVCESFPINLHDEQSLIASLELVSKNDHGCNTFSSPASEQLKNLLKPSDQSSKDMCIQDIVKFFSCNDKHLYKVRKSNALQMRYLSDVNPIVKLLEIQDSITNKLKVYGNTPFHDSLHDKFNKFRYTTSYEAINQKECDDCDSEECLLNKVMDKVKATDIYAERKLVANEKYERDSSSGSASSYRANQKKTSEEKGNNTNNETVINDPSDYYQKTNKTVKRFNRNYYNPYDFNNSYKNSKDQIDKKVVDEVKKVRKETFDKLPTKVKDKLGVHNPENLTSKKLDDIWSKLNSNKEKSQQDKSILELLDQLRQQQKNIERLENEIKEVKTNKQVKYNQTTKSDQTVNDYAINPNHNDSHHEKTEARSTPTASGSVGNKSIANKTANEAIDQMKSSMLSYIDNRYKQNSVVKDQEVIMQAYEAAKDHILQKLEKGDLTGISVDAYLERNTFIENQNNDVWLLQKVKKNINDNGHIGTIVVIDKKPNGDNDFTFVEYKISNGNVSIIGKEKLSSLKNNASKADSKTTKGPRRSITAEQLNTDLNEINEQIKN